MSPINIAAVDAMTLVHEKFEAKGMEPTGKKASVLEIMGLAGHLGHVFFFLTFLFLHEWQNKKASKQLLKVRLFAEVCWIVALLEQGWNHFLGLKSLKTIISFFSLFAGIICSFFCSRT